MHLYTTVKVKAKDEDEAIERVNSLLTNYGEYNFSGGFDYVSEDETAVLKDFTEKDFIKLRNDEIKEYKSSLKRALELEDTDTMKGFYLVSAGEALQDDIFWSTQRYAYILDHEDGENTYYLTTDRHC